MFCPAPRLLVLHLCRVDRGGVPWTATVMAAVFPHIEMDPLNGSKKWRWLIQWMI